MNDFTVVWVHHATGQLTGHGKGSAFAAVKTGGQVIWWGNLRLGGDSSTLLPRLCEGVVSISATDQAFAAIKEDGCVIT